MIVNPVYIDQFVGPLIGGADSEDELDKYSFYKPDKESDVKKLAKSVLIPEYQKRAELFKNEMKNALAYYLYHDTMDFESVIDSLLLPIETPKDPRLFFQWLWEVFFEGESYDFIAKEDVTEEFDIEAPLKLMRIIKQMGNRLD